MRTLAVHARNLRVGDNVLAARLRHRVTRVTFIDMQVLVETIDCVGRPDILVVGETELLELA